jgi:ABC-type Fe3+ transport system permease subunit
LRIRSFLLEAYTLPLLLTLPTVLALAAVRQWFFARTYPQVALQIVIGLSPYAVGLAWATWTGRVWKVNLRSQNKTKMAVAVPLVGPENRLSTNVEAAE